MDFWVGSLYIYYTTTNFYLNIYLSIINIFIFSIYLNCCKLIYMQKPCIVYHQKYEVVLCGKFIITLTGTKCFHEIFEFCWN